MHHIPPRWSEKKTGWQSGTGVLVLNLTLCRVGQLTSPVWASFSLKLNHFSALYSHQLSILTLAISTQVEEIWWSRPSHWDKWKVCRMQNLSIKKANQENPRELGGGTGCSLRTLFSREQFGLAAFFKVLEPQTAKTGKYPGSPSHSAIKKRLRKAKFTGQGHLAEHDRARTKHQPFW